MPEEIFMPETMGKGSQKKENIEKKSTPQKVNVDVNLKPKKEVSQKDKDSSVDMIRIKDNTVYDKGAKKVEEPINEGNVILNWQSPEFVYYEKSIFWLIFGIIILALAVFILFYFREWYTVVVFILLAIVFFQYGYRKPQLKSYTITENGFKIDDKFYPFAKFEHFGILKTQNVSILNLKYLKKIMPLLTVQLIDVNVSEIEKNLKNKLPEEHFREGFFDKFTRVIRF